MSKSVSLFLSAALTFGSVFSTSAAPLAKKYCAAGSPRGQMSAQVEMSNGPGLNLNSRLARRLADGNVEGLVRLTSETRLQNRRALKSATSASRELDAGLDLRGVVLSFYTSGLYKLPKTTGGEFSPVAEFEATYQFGSIDNGAGLFYGVNYTSFGPMAYITLETYDTSTWQMISSTTNLGYSVCSTAAALDPVSGDIFGCFYLEDDSSKYVWAKADYENYTSIPIADLEVDLIGLGADGDGQFYGVGSDGIFYKIDKATGDMDAIAPVDVEHESPFVSGCVDRANNRFLQTWNSLTTGSGLLEIDLETGETTPLLEFDGSREVVGAYIAPPPTADKAPAAPAVSVFCESGSMDVRVAVTMPETLFDGTPATGQTFSYSVKSNGRELISGQAAAGEEIVETVTMDLSGKTTFLATASNSTGVSPLAKTSCFVGKGAPAAPKNVKLSWADGVATIAWDPVTTSSDGGFFDPSEVTYTILSGDGAELATQASTTFSTPEPQRDEYTVICYKVKANYNGKSSAAVSSNKFVLGALAVPFSMDMSVKANFEIHSIIDANEDGNTWVYSQNRTNYGYCMKVADDWLFSPPVALQAGKVYRFYAKAAPGNDSFSERIEIFAGNAPSIDAMGIEIVEPTEIEIYGGQLVEKYFSVPANGNYNFGFHAISDADMYNLYLDLYGVEVAESSGPAAVTDATIVPDAEGALKASISFKAPVKSLDGNDLKGSVTVKVLRDEVLVGEVSVNPGKEGNIIDSDIPEKGTYTYSFVPFNIAGAEGEACKVTVYVGPKVPADVNPRTVSLEEPSPGTFLFKWDKVTTTVDGAPINPDNLTYKVFVIGTNPNTGALIVEDELATVSGTSYTYVTEPIVKQGYFRLGVLSYNIDQGANYMAVASVFTGENYEMPVSYSNRADLENYFLGLQGTGQVSVADYSYFKIPAQDDDNAFFAVLNENLIGASTTLVSGVVNISGELPVVQFYMYPAGENDINKTIVSVVCDGEETELKSFIHAETIYTDTWNKVKASLADFVGKAVQVKIKTIINRYRYAMYDNIQICQDILHDLAVVNISAPAKVACGEEFGVTVFVENQGAANSGPYTVSLMRDGEIVDSKTISSSLEASDTQIVVFRQTMGLHDDERADFQAMVTYDADECPDNNQSKVITVARNISTLPRVTGLDGESTGSGNLLSWTPIIINEDTPMTVTEDFEEGESWAHEFEGWTFVDVDGKELGGFEGTDLPGIYPTETKAAFFVFDSAYDLLIGNQSFAPHSGDKYLAAMFPFDNGRVDDWAISPVLSGDAQTVSFFAKSYSADYPEEIEVWYSTTGTDVKSFVKVDAFGTKTLPEVWTEYSALLPQGAKHFAIRSVATGSWMLMVDDVTYTRLGGFDGELKGYNVYCDGVKLNDTPLAEASYLHVLDDAAAHTYHVTAVYDKGESELSSPVIIDRSGVDQVLAARFNVAVEGRHIVVTGTAGSLVAINAVDGRTIHSAKGDARVAVSPAIYLVTVDRKTVKVIVR